MVYERSVFGQWVTEKRKQGLIANIRVWVRSSWVCLSGVCCQSWWDSLSGVTCDLGLSCVADNGRVVWFYVNLSRRCCIRRFVGLCYCGCWVFACLVVTKQISFDSIKRSRLDPRLEESVIWNAIVLVVEFVLNETRIGCLRSVKQCKHGFQTDPENITLDLWNPVVNLVDVDQHAGSQEDAWVTVIEQVIPKSKVRTE